MPYMFVAHRVRLLEYQKINSRVGSLFVRLIMCTCREQRSSWEFSAEAIRLISRYARAFPQLFHGLARRGGDRFFEANVSVRT